MNECCERITQALSVVIVLALKDASELPHSNKSMVKARVDEEESKTRELSMNLTSVTTDVLMKSSSMRL